ncbi:DNA-directed RNA polymerases I, II, and III subunit RPABC4 [Nematocida sp. LUAm3]|nr:DNA-directed RNA polymerases I, II, and III subunit RPABC4 [Nematocida sp. LUAm3]KAI5176194.1 DNA-directed RNA polymerases I, II, and III subunit RPABC4 [Nematocida sp. LUAm2]KAI5179182.1 DNA-directed RNA polymerases I, II, and III subunit RPABC4 [Nematocida sp. LUAm1]
MNEQNEVKGFMDEKQEIKSSYQCSECKMIVVIGIKDAVRCGDCGCRILYKLRNNTWTQYEAR